MSVSVLARPVFVATSPLKTEIKGTKGNGTSLKPMTFGKEDWFPTLLSHVGGDCVSLFIYFAVTLCCGHHSLAM